MTNSTIVDTNFSRREETVCPTLPKKARLMEIPAKAKLQRSSKFLCCSPSVTAKTAISATNDSTIKATQEFNLPPVTVTALPAGEEVVVVRVVVVVVFCWAGMVSSLCSNPFALFSLVVFCRLLCCVLWMLGVRK